MVKYRPRIKGKGKKWKKGQSSSSNPSSTKFRDAAKSRFFQENLGSASVLTSEALQKHNLFVDSGENDFKRMTIDDADDEKASSVGGSTIKTVDTFATEFSGCTNISYSKLMNSFNPDSAVQKEKLAILAAVAEVIKSNGGTENNTEYFGAMMTMLENSELEEMSVAAVLSLLAMGIKGVPQAVLQLRFSQCSKIFLSILAKYSESQNNIIFRGVLTCLSVLLRSQDLSVWKDFSTRQIFDSILMFTVHSKPKVRKAAQHAVCALLRANRTDSDNINKNFHHPAASIAAEFCVLQIEKSGSLSGSATSTLHILGLMKDIMMTFPKKHLKTACETILKVMTLGNVLILSCGMQALHGLFVSRPPETVLSSDLNARLITALYDYQPQSTDSQPTQAWLAVMQEAIINLSKLNLSLCLTNLIRLLVSAEALWLTGKPEVINAATLTIKACLEDCLTAAASKEVVHYNHHNINKVIELLRAGLSYQYNKVWPHVLHLIGILFKAVGETCGQMLLPLLKELGDLRDSFKFSFMNELDYCVGNAVRSMGPESVLNAIPLQINDNDAKYDFKRSWLIPILRENIHSSTLKCFTEYFLPLATKCRKKSEELSTANDKVGSISFDLMQSQIWALLPSFCSRPSDISSSFPGMAKALGVVLGTRKDLKLTVMASLRKLISWSTETQNEADLKELKKYAKNYLPILFNIYTTPSNGSEEEGIRLAALETITVYLSIADYEIINELFNKATTKLYNKDLDSFVKHSVLDLIRVLLSYQPPNIICELYDKLVSQLGNVKDHKEQKKYYRILEEICKCGTENCRGFLNERILKIQSLLLNSLSSSATSSKGPRLRCLISLLENYPEVSENLITETIPEAVLSCCDINSRSRASAYELLVKMSQKMAENGKFSEYVEMIMAGLAGAPRVVSASLLALTTITYHNKELVLSTEILPILLDNVYILLSSSSREIVGAALSFVKLYISTFGQEICAGNLPKLMKAIVTMTEDCKRHFRLKTRDILSRLVRWFSADIILKLIPESEVNLRSRVRNIRKIEDRKKKVRQQQLDAKKDKSEDVQFSVKKGPKSIDEILAESDSDFELDNDQDSKIKPIKKKKRAETWIQEDDNDFTDFTVPSANKKIIATNPLLKNEPTEQQKKKKQHDKDGGFKFAPDGRMIIKDNDLDSDDDKKKRFSVPGLSDSDDYEEDDDDNVTITDKKTVASTKVSEYNRKRKLSVCSNSTGAPPMKYQAGGSGIHRPVGGTNMKKIKSKTDSKKNYGMIGAEYRSKKAGGDVKRKGLPDPYAYLPLQKNMLNRRKRMKAAGQFKTIIKHARKGAKIGRIQKQKSNR